MISTFTTTPTTTTCTFSISSYHHAIINLTTSTPKSRRAFDCRAVPLHSKERKASNYDPNIWHFDFIQSLGRTSTNNSNSNKNTHSDRFQCLKHDLLLLLSQPMDTSTQLVFIDCILKLGLSNLFEQQIKDVLDGLVLHDDNSQSIYFSALRFRLLRKYGHVVSLVSDDPLDNLTSLSLSVEALGELLEASNLAREGEDTLDAVRDFSVDSLKERVKHMGSHLSKTAYHSLELPLHRRVPWFDVKWQIEAYERSTNNNPVLLELAKRNFNELQAVHQDDLKNVSRWWRDLGLIQHLHFARDRLVESYIFALGVAPESEAKSLRRSLTKVIAMILVIDDIYDIFGSFEELKCFTRALKTWDSNEIDLLPKCMQVSFRALDDITTQIAREIGAETDFDQVVSHLRKSWANFCDGMFMEAKWDNTKHVPTMGEYLDNAWITSSCPLILSHAYYFLSSVDNNVPMLLEVNKSLIYNSSVITRLCNDLRTSTAERERGDAPSSVACYMQEVKVSEEKAREHIEGMITRSWKGMNNMLYGDRKEHSCLFMEMAVNVARTAHMVYQHGDGFGVQGVEMRELITASLFQPFILT